MKIHRHKKAQKSQKGFGLDLGSFARFVIFCGQPDL
jgi:hypothetical protein